MDGKDIDQAPEAAELQEGQLDDVAGGVVYKPVKLGPKSSDPETGGELK